MEFNDIFLKDIAHYEPDEFITSNKIENELEETYSRLKLPFGRIEMQTGIQSRGIFHQKLPSDIAIGAGKNLFKKGNIIPNDIDLLIFSSVCRDFLEPSTASVVHEALGLRSDCQSFDLSNACLGVVSAMEMSAKLIESGAYQNILIVTGENATPLISKTIETLKHDENLTRKSIKKYFANFTIGSAGVALVISKNSGIAQVMNSIGLSDTSAHKLCQGSGSMDGLVMETESEELKERGVALAYKAYQEFKQLNNNINFDHFICHQVGIHHQEFLYKTLELDITKDYSSFYKYGNTGSAALPLTLSLAIDENIIQKNESIALLGIGSGLHSIMMRLKWS